MTEERYEIEDAEMSNDGDVDGVVKEFNNPSSEPVTIRVKGTSARGLMGSCFKSILDGANPDDPNATDVIPAGLTLMTARLARILGRSKWDRVKQLFKILFCPWTVWNLHDAILEKNEQIEKLIGDIEQLSEQRDAANRAGRQAFMSSLKPGALP